MTELILKATDATIAILTKESAIVGTEIYGGFIEFMICDTVKIKAITARDNANLFPILSFPSKMKIAPNR
jgi:hypothetical protein